VTTVVCVAVVSIADSEFTLSGGSRA